MPRVLDRLATPIGLVLALAMAVALVAPPAAAAEAPDMTPAAAVATELGLINADRAAAGLVALRSDPRLMTIAAERAATMASTGQLSHTGPDGRTVFDMIGAAGITWYGAGEVIAWNTWPTLAGSATAANEGWMGSEVHRDLLLSTDENYVGIGVATSTNGTKYWAAVLMKGPDRTGAWARMAAATLSRLSGASFVRVGWTGGDLPLQVLTSGLRDFQLQRRTDGGSWWGVVSATALRSWTLRVAPGHHYEFRVRARDRAGNYGAWTSTVGITA